MSAAILSVFQEVRDDVIARNLSLPEVGIAELADLEVWGRAFVKKMVSFLLLFSSSCAYNRAGGSSGTRATVQRYP